MRRLLLTLWLAAWLSALPAAAQQHIDKLLLLMQQRLALAPMVAQVKWNNHLPVDDPVREEQLLEKVPQIDRPFCGLSLRPARSFSSSVNATG